MESTSLYEKTKQLIEENKKLRVAVQQLREDLVASNSALQQAKADVTKANAQVEKHAKRLAQFLCDDESVSESA